LKPGRSRKATGEWRIVSIAIFSAFLVSCSAVGDTAFDISSPSFAPGGGATLSQSGTEDFSGDPGSGDPGGATEVATVDGSTGNSTSTPATSVVSTIEEGDPALPEQVAYLPASNPAAAFPSTPAADSSAPVAQTAEAQPAEQQPEPVVVTAGVPLPAPSPARFAEKTEPPAVSEPSTTTENQAYVTAAAPEAAPMAPKKRGFLSSFFGTSPAHSATQRKPAPIIDLASRESAKPIVTASLSTTSSRSGDDLPGVRKTALFEITRKSGLDDDDDIDVHEDENPPVQVASAAGLARLAPNGLITQTDKVDVACLKPSLVRVLKKIESHYGHKIVVTSGYRSPTHNRRARGAKNSLHMYCAAADVQVAGVTKWELAAYLRSMPGRGGVGTYCYTNSVHIDIGPERDWNWRCRRRKK
jgi:uncharacterized protein YcbK (DUF882 family)